MYGINNIGKVFNNVRDFYNNINTATLTGAIDVVVVEQPDGSFTCSPFHVRFGKLGVLRSKERIVDIEINSEPVNIHMKLGDSGEAFFSEPIINTEENDVTAQDDILPSNFTNETQTVTQHTIRNNSDQLSRITELNAEADTLSDDIAPCNNSPHVLQNNSITVSVENISVDTYNKNSNEVLYSSQETFSLDASDVIQECFKVKNDAQNTNKLSEELVEIQSSEKDIDSNFTHHNASNDNFVHSDELHKSDMNCESVDTEDNAFSQKVDFHFFSDTDASPGASPPRPSSPHQSDTEAEFERSKRIADDFEHSQWRWGELPSLSPAREESPYLHGICEAKHSRLSNMFTFMKATKRYRHNTEPTGIYLDDLNASALDPHLADVYLRTSYYHLKNSKEDMDGKFDMLQDATDTVASDSDKSEEPAIKINESIGHITIETPADLDVKKNYLKDLAMSLCSGLSETESVEARFDQHIVNYEDILHNPKLVEDPNLVVRLSGKYYNWNNACLQVMSVNIFGKPLPDTTAPNIIQRKDGASSPGRGYSNWFSWWRSNETKKIDSEDQLESRTPESVHDEKGENAIDLYHENISVTEECGKNSPYQPEEAQYETNLEYQKILRLSSEQIKSLNLKSGVNEAVFSVTTAYQGTTRCKCYIYRWRYDDKIVISDIDGTITRSDVLGHILPIIGKDWAQSGVAQLFHNIASNGYKLMYLSARAIGQSWLTREYLKSVKQENLQLPDGPLLLNPISLLNAFHSEVFAKKSEEFKVSCLNDIKLLFPDDNQPFYAGYGNKICDVWAYREIGIPKSRIFTINYKGEVRHEFTQTFQSSYSNLSSIVDQMFPPLVSEAPSTVDYGGFLYWREPVEIVMEEDEGEKSS